MFSLERKNVLELNWCLWLFLNTNWCWNSMNDSLRLHFESLLCRVKGVNLWMLHISLITNCLKQIQTSIFFFLALTLNNTNNNEVLFVILFIMWFNHTKPAWKIIFIFFNRWQLNCFHWSYLRWNIFISAQINCCFTSPVTYLVTVVKYILNLFWITQTMNLKL